jgi:Meiotically up-regulated gene 113
LLDPRLHEERARHLYLLAGEGAFVKIGVSKAPRTRRSQLQISTPRRLTLEGQWRFGARVAVEVEGYLKKAFAELRVSGEWFEVEPRVMAAAIETLHPDPSNKVLIPVAVAYAVANRNAGRLDEKMRELSRKERAAFQVEEDASFDEVATTHAAAWNAGFRPNPWDVVFVQEIPPAGLAADGMTPKHLRMLL